jgi:leucyl-tRNA synthetase
MDYVFRDIEKKWQQKWKEEKLYEVSNPGPGDLSMPKCYVLDMFPYPSGAGLHVGHPLGYIASDIFARFKRLKGFRVLHPMGYDAFGLPAEQYAIDNGIHPAVSTAANIANFRAQLDKIGFCFDWSRQVNTSEPEYYRWTQWIFLQLFNSWYNRDAGKAEPIESLIARFGQNGSSSVTGYRNAPPFTTADWQQFTEKQQQDILMEYRLCYCGYGEVNWCEALGTVLANDEVINGLSERGGFPVIRKKLRQWYLRITEYADRLLEGLEKVDFSEAMKEMQSNWVGKSFGAEINFRIPGSSSPLTVYTTRPDTIFGVDFLVVAPEHELIPQISAPAQQQAVADYIAYVKSRSERERMAEKKITGCFTGAYALHPFSQQPVPVWISEYVLAGYGTGAIMAVPCGDERDFKFARQFDIPITNIIGHWFNGQEANPTKDAVLENSDFLDGIVMRDAIQVVINKLEALGTGQRRINYKMRDAAFSRQRYWGEPFPVVWKNGIAYPLDETELPLELPKVDNYKPGPDGEGPLANIPDWYTVGLPPTRLTSVWRGVGGEVTELNATRSEEFGLRETNTMPGYAGSSWYFLRYMDPHNTATFCDRRISDYWGQVDLYVGGTEHAVGHLLYSRMWTKFLFDRGWISFEEPYKKLLNQGMIQGSSRFVFRIDLKGAEEIEEHLRKNPLFISFGIKEKLSEKELNDLITNKICQIFSLDRVEIPVISVAQLHTDVNMVDGLDLDMTAFRNWRPEYKDAIFICEDGSVNAPTKNKETVSIPEEGHAMATLATAWRGNGSEVNPKYICGIEIEKMSKSKFNTVNPNDLVVKYGADTFRMYEMFLGPLEQSKPWDTKGIEGVHRFLRKWWRLFYDEQKGKVWTTEKATGAELKVLHKAIKKIEEDTERFSFNTAVSACMIAVNELGDLKCRKKEILDPFLIILSPYAPHICEELWQLTGNSGTILDAAYPVANQKYLLESAKNYPVAINGKTRTELNISLDATQAEVETLVLGDEVVRRWLEGKAPKKVIYVKNKMINVVI